MGHGKHPSSSSYPTPAPPAPIADYNVATNPALVPDCSCNYFLAGTYNGQPYYRRVDGLFFIWFDTENWQIAPHVPTELFDPYWVRENINIIGEYAPQGGAAGIATVSAGPH